MKKLLCFPFGGGSASYYFRWRGLLGNNYTIIAPEFAGRSSRFSEAQYESFDDFFVDISGRAAREIDGKPYIVYGHSMGALWAYEFIRHLIISGYPLPKGLIVSGQVAPDRLKCVSGISRLPDDDFIRCLDGFSGIPGVIRDNPELLAIFLPSLRNDFMLYESYGFLEPSGPFPFPILVQNGKRDVLPLIDLMAWGRFSSKGMKLREYPGGHFFIDENRTEVLQDIFLYMDSV